MRSWIIAFASIYLFSAGCAHRPQAPAENNNPTSGARDFSKPATMSFPIIDAHVHTKFNGKPEVNSNSTGTLESCLS